MPKGGKSHLYYDLSSVYIHAVVVYDDLNMRVVLKTLSQPPPIQSESSECSTSSSEVVSHDREVDEVGGTARSSPPHLGTGLPKRLARDSSARQRFGFEYIEYIEYL